MVGKGQQLRAALVLVEEAVLDAEPIDRVGCAGC